MTYTSYGNMGLKIPIPGSHQEWELEVWNQNYRKLADKCEALENNLDEAIEMIKYLQHSNYYDYNTSWPADGHAPDTRDWYRSVPGFKTISFYARENNGVVMVHGISQSTGTQGKLSVGSTGNFKNTQIGVFRENDGQIFPPIATSLMSYTIGPQLTYVVKPSGHLELVSGPPNTTIKKGDQISWSGVWITSPHLYEQYYNKPDQYKESHPND